MKKILPLVLILSTPAFGAITGFVTPTEMTITFTEASLITADNKNITLLSGSFATTFRKSATDFAAISLGGITAPGGRFLGVRVCYNTDRTVKLNGDVYHGTAVNSYVDGMSQVWSVGTSGATASGSVTRTTTASPTTLTGYVVGNGSNNCSDSYFASPVCVATDVASCSAGDRHIDPGATVPNLNIMLDLFNSVGVDASTNALDNHIPIYPYPTIGTPGAAIHLTSSTAGAIGNVSLLFGSDRALLYSAAYTNSNVAGLCSGNGFVTVTAGPGGAYINAYGPTAVQSFASTGGSAGLVQFAAGNCGSSSTCTSNGINVLDNVLQNVPSTVNISCVADTLATPSKLGYSYTSGAGVASTTPLTISKIVDPSNVLGHCPTPPCGSY